MAIKGQQILHDANGYVVDRAQSAGVGNVNINEEKIYELGNYNSVGTVRDFPDLTFELESFDMTTEIEAILTGEDPETVPDGFEFDFINQMPIDVISPYKDKGGSFNIIRGIVVPYLTLENVTYRFGVGENSTQSFSLRGDGIYYVKGSPYYEEFANTGNDTYNFAHTALPYTEGGDTVYALGVCLKNSTTKKYKRLFLGEDFTNTSAGITLLEDLSADYDVVHVVYGSLDQANYPQSVHPDVEVKPAAIRAKDIDVYIGTNDATPVFSRWTNVQSFEVTRSVTLEQTQEFGNAHYVSSDYDTADVTGSITVTSFDAEELWDKIADIANITGNDIIGPLSSVALPIELVVRHPDTGDTLKTLYIPDARFTIPGYQPRVQTRLESTFNFTSDGGDLLVYKGDR